MVATVGWLAGLRSRRRCATAGTKCMYTCVYVIPGRGRAANSVPARQDCTDVRVFSVVQRHEQRTARNGLGDHLPSHSVRAYATASYAYGCVVQRRVECRVFVPVCPSSIFPTDCGGAGLAL